jgi:cobalamin-dependent methionine synthase I
LSFPDVNSLPKLAEIFEVSVDELMQVKAEEVLSFLNQIESNSAIRMIGIGLACISVSLFQKKCDE